MEGKKMNDRATVIRGATLEKREKARELRGSMTPAEKAVWARLRRRSCGGYNFRRQQILIGYIVDFYCVEKKLIVEIDGAIHDAQRVEDKQRSDALEAAGFNLIRFKNKEVFDSIDHVVHRIVQELCKN